MLVLVVELEHFFLITLLVTLLGELELDLLSTFEHNGIVEVDPMVFLQL